MRLAFNGIRGRIRLDPSARAGRFRLTRTILTRLDTNQVILDLVREGLTKAWHVEGTARLLDSPPDAGVFLESTGNDPILQLTAWSGEEGIPVKLEVNMTAI